MSMLAGNVREERSRPVSLISWATEHCTQAFLNSVQVSGFRVQRVDDQQWAESPAPNASTIVLVGNDSGISEDFRDRLVTSPGPRLLVIADDPDAAGSSNGRTFVNDDFHDFLVWPCSRFELVRRVGLLFQNPGDSLEHGENELSRQLSDIGVIGRSSGFLRAMGDLVQFASSDAPVLIQGETGTGKELAARAIHHFSDRAERPFVSFNCGAIPDNLIENELFGHERGAFTDAKNSQVGLVAEADGGTLFLDEVDTLSAVAQVALLRFLETHEYRTLGGKGLKHSDARIVAASNADLSKLAESGQFRRDLLFRLDVCGVLLPPLRERRSDIELLTSHFLKRYAEKYDRSEKTVHPGTMEWLLTHRWEGNIRELDNFLHRQFLLCNTAQIFVPAPVPGQSACTASHANGVPWRNMSYKVAKAAALDTFERSYLTWLMAEARGNLSLAARKTSQQRSSLRRLLHKHQIDKNAWKAQ